jgi:uncharacterized RDD family membrane protein YckC
MGSGSGGGGLVKKFIRCLIRDARYLGILASFVALTAVSDADYYGVGFLQRTQNLHALHPWWLGWTEVASEVWVWSEVVVMLFNRQRRALHDFIAGTVVTAEKTIPHTQIHTA